MTNTRIYLIAGVILLLILQYNLWFAKNGLLSRHHLSQQIHAQKLANKSLEDHNQLLEQQIQGLKHNHAVIEQQARQNFNMIHKGETYYQIVSPAKGS